MPKWTKEQMDAITKSGSNIIVSAGAGSGKTAVLSQRVLDKINNGIHINELLILTFTKAASAEMKERIRGKLLSDPKYKDEIDLINSSYITTFDSFALGVVKKYHYLLNVSSDISISDEAIISIKSKEIMDSIFEELYSSGDEVFESIINKFCIKNDNNIRSNILKLANQINNKINKYELIDYLRSDYFSDENINKILSDFDEFIKLKKRIINLELNNLSYYTDSSFMESVYTSVSSLLSSKSSDLYKYSKVILPNLPRGSSEEAKNIKSNVKKILDELVAYGDYGSFDDIKNSILGNKIIINKVLDIVSEYIRLLSDYKQKNNIYTFSDIAYLSIKVLKDNKSVLDEIKSSFKEIMIDEYQDTNDIQDAFIKLIENNNVYMVGDIKQSIYKFRDSNPNIFKEKYDKYSLGDGGIKIDLIKNFRSRSEVLDNINRIFELLMDNSIGGCDYKTSHEMVYGNTSYDEEKLKDYNYDIDILEYVDDSKEYSGSEIEIFTIANDIKSKINSNIKIFDKKTNKLRDCKYSDFVIILDRSKYFNLYKRVFEYLGIPLSILRDEDLNNSSDILILKNMFDLLYRINNNLFDNDFKHDFMSIGRSFLYEYSDSYLFDVVKNNSYKDTSLYQDFSSIKSINSKSVECIFNELIDVTDYYNKLNKIGEFNSTNIRLNTLYEMSLNLNDFGYDYEEFINYLDSILDSDMSIRYSSSDTSSDSVKIITIHGSKGLEYPICYFADLDHKFNISDINDKFILGDNYGLIYQDSDKCLLKNLYKFKYLKEEIGERMRLFYVALSRAREKMIIVLPYKDTMKLEKDENGVIDENRRISFNKLSDFVYSIKDYLSDYFSSVDINNIGLTKNYLYKKSISSSFKSKDTNIVVSEINISNEEISEEHFSKENIALIDKSTYEKMEYGTRVHEVLELIDFNNYDESITPEDIRGYINTFINSDLMKNISDAKIYKEYEFEYVDKDTSYHGVIDLMLEYDDHIDIIDYKLKDISDKKYIEQLKGYKKYINKLSNKMVNLYLYSIFDGKYDII